MSMGQHRRMTQIKIALPACARCRRLIWTVGDGSTVHRFSNSELCDPDNENSPTLIPGDPVWV